MPTDALSTKRVHPAWNGQVHPQCQQAPAQLALWASISSAAWQAVAIPTDALSTKHVRPAWNGQVHLQCRRALVFDVNVGNIALRPRMVLACFVPRAASVPRRTVPHAHLARQVVSVGYLVPHAAPCVAMGATLTSKASNSAQRCFHAAKTNSVLATMKPPQGHVCIVSRAHSCLKTRCGMHNAPLAVQGGSMTR